MSFNLANNSDDTNCKRTLHFQIAMFGSKKEVTVRGQRGWGEGGMGGVDMDIGLGQGMETE
jgi:hypothetical protein